MVVIQGILCEVFNLTGICYKIEEKIFFDYKWRKNELDKFGQIHFAKNNVGKSKLGKINIG